ncbi:MAG: Serine/threonine-protein phosphatase [candidate division TM6 bacterium GW2011_GWF2_38_10]|nr:MAG: Serine/threonine-protein phosphatase [candidate division TM6 bacterium GW2011_GWF2_38_10]
MNIIVRLYMCVISLHLFPLVFSMDSCSSSPLASPAVLLKAYCEQLYEFDGYCFLQDNHSYNQDFFKKLAMHCGTSVVNYDLFNNLLDGVIQLLEERYWEEFKCWPQSACCNYAGACVVPYKSIIIAMGDYHGSLHSLLRNVMRLRYLGLMDKHFRLNPDVKLVFLGDIGGRGFYSFELWTFILALMLCNPNNIIVLQGNHETEALFSSDGSLYEFLAKLGDEEKVHECLRKMYYFFSLLPQTFFIGTRSSSYEPVHFIQFCHGGLSEYKECKELSCGPKFFLKEMPWRKLLIGALYKKGAGACYFSYLQQHFSQDNGLLWNSFYADDDPNAPLVIEGGRDKFDLMHHGKAVYKYFSQLGYKGLFTVDALVRGHDHISCGVGRLTAYSFKNSDSYDADRVFLRIDKKDVITRERLVSQYPVFTISSVAQMQHCDAFAVLRYDAHMTYWSVVPYVYPLSFETLHGFHADDIILARKMLPPEKNKNFFYTDYKKIAHIIWP